MGLARSSPPFVASGPPLTSTGGHCHFLGGEVSATGEIVRGVAERAERGVDVVKVMASGGVNTPGSDVMCTQFTTAELCLDRRSCSPGWAAGRRPRARHSRGEQAIAVRVTDIEHSICVTDRGFQERSICARLRSAKRAPYRDGVARYFDGSLARIVEGAFGKPPALPRVNEPGFPCGTEFVGVDAGGGVLRSLWPVCRCGRCRGPVVARRVCANGSMGTAR